MIQTFHVKKSLERIYKTFIRLKSQIYDQDKEALKTLINSFEETQEQIALTDLPYTKCIALLMYHYTQHTQDAKQANFLLKKDLEMPLGFHIEQLKNQITNVNTMKFYESIGLVGNLKESEQNRIIEENEKEIINQLQKEFSFEIVKKSLYNTANDLQFNENVKNV